MLFDSHCHLTDGRLHDEAEELIERAHENGVRRLVTIGADPKEFDGALELANRFDTVWASVGVHPHIADRLDTGVLERIQALAEEPRIVAIGETGLDYYYDNAPRATQRRAFERHVELAAELEMPLIVHTREADDDTIAIVRDAGSADVRGVLHCFTGGAALLETALEEGWYISFSGIVSFNGYEDGDLVREVPNDRILIETDSPYLAPTPKRGRRNEPAYVRYVAEAVATLRKTTVDVVGEQTTQNAVTFYGIETPNEA